MVNLADFYYKNADFKEFVDKCMRTYNWTLEYALASPITKNYYEYLIATS